MTVVYALSDKGARECTAPRSRLPSELHGLLRMVDGQRTRDELLTVTGKSTLTVGGLRWLSDAGYIHPCLPPQPVAVPARPQPAAAPVSAPAPAATRPASATGTTPAPVTADDVCRALSALMLRAITRYLGRYAYKRQIASARSVAELLPHLHPLIDAIVVRAGAEAAAEFADSAAFLLDPAGSSTR